MKEKLNENEIKWCVIACQVLGCWDCLSRNSESCKLKGKQS